MSSDSLKVGRHRSVGVAARSGLLLVAAVAGGCASASTSGGGSVASSIPTCSFSQPVRDLPVFSVGVSAVGHVCWETSLTTPAVGSHSYSSPLAASDRAILDSDGDVFAVGLADGRVEWEWKSGSPRSNGDNLGGNQTIAVAQGVVITTRVAQDNKGYVVGLDERTGHLRWQRPEPAQIGEGPYDSGNGSVVFTSYRGTVVEVLDDQTGSVLWSEPEPSLPAGSGLVSVASLFSSVAGVLVVGSPDGGIDGVDPATGKIKWHYAVPVHTMTVVAGVLLLTELHLGAGPITQTTIALDPTSGRTLWSLGPARDVPSYTGAGTALMSMLWGTQSDSLSRIDPFTGQPMWSARADAYAVATLGAVTADVENTSYQSGAGYVVGRNSATGATMWKTLIGGTNLIHASVFSLQSPTGPVFAVQNGEQLTGYDAHSGLRKWEIDLPSDTLVDGTAATTTGLVIQVSGSQYFIEGH